jgi:inner membrane protein
MVLGSTGERTPAFKLLIAILIAAALAIPIFMVWFLVYDRQNQSQEAQASITAGWGGPQAIAGPVLVIPYRASATETVIERGQSVTRNRDVMRELTMAPETVVLKTDIQSQHRKRSIYEAVIYDAKVEGTARFAMPPDLARFGVALPDLRMDRAELRFSLSDPRGLGANPKVKAQGAPLRLQPGGGSTGGRGFFAFMDAAPLAGGGQVAVDFAYDVRGNGALSLAPQAGDTSWTATSNWPHPSFGGSFIPGARQITDKGFSANYRIGNLALGRALISTADAGSVSEVPAPDTMARVKPGMGIEGQAQTAEINLIQPVDLYSRVDRSAKYGFLFIGFTFLALLMFDVIGGVRVSAVEYLLMGAALVLFFVLLLAFAEVIGFTPAYLLASAAISGLNTAYAAAVLKSWRRAAFIGGLLIGLYAVLYILLSLEAFSLLIGSLLLFAALAGVMYATRHIDWGARRGTEASI